MNIAKILVTAILFYILSPGVVISLPPGASRQVQLLTHGVVFAIVSVFVWKATKRYV